VQHSFKILYFDLVPPSPFLREANKVVACFAVCIIALAFVWSLNAFPNDPLTGVVADGIVISTFLVGLWYVSLTTSSLWRLTQYRRAAPKLPYHIYQLLYPWLGLLIINSTIFLLIMAERSAAPDSQNRLYLRALLFKVLLAELAPLVAFEVPVVKNWLPRFEPMKFVRIFRKGLCILIGRDSRTDVYAHAKEVVQFQSEFAIYMEDNAGQSAEKQPLYPYFNFDGLQVFQRSLSCLVETSRCLGKELDKQFKGRRWTLLDIGGGEGIFTCELLKNICTPPHGVTMIDPAKANVSAYRDRLVEQFPTVRNVDTYISTIETMYEELPHANCVLASHSLYAVFDQNRKKAANIVSRLIDTVEDGVAVFILAARDSYLYTIKKMVLAELHLVDRSSFGEDLLAALPPGCRHLSRTIDSIADVTSLIEDYDALVNWLAYFCRVDRTDLEPHFDLIQSLVRNTAIDFRCLPQLERSRLDATGVTSAMKLNDESQIIYHKELVIIIPSSKTVGLQTFEQDSL
jgi:hypothetical protein